MIYKHRLIGSKTTCRVTTMKLGKLLFKVVELLGNIIIAQEITYSFQPSSQKHKLFMLIADSTEVFGGNECDFSVRALVREGSHGHFIISKCISSPSFGVIIDDHPFVHLGVSRQPTKLSVIVISFYTCN